ncbi:VOC family protein [Leifsonia sp. NPDC058248]|uniref:VOC family protein n=1 Tax=Leifsonia sp. NPDC058248 TaxID=3346402 RepID=UPI0036D93E13
MVSRLNPYLNFRGSAREAMAFYQSVFGGSLESNTFAEFNVSDDPSESDQIMHSQLTTPSGFVIMAADVPKKMDLKEGSQLSISLSGDDEAELTGYWQKLIDGGTVVEPLAKAPWGDSFGMTVDRFGIAWLVNISGTPAA